MDYIFNGAVKGKKEGYRFVVNQTFAGNGPWVKLGTEFSHAEDWFEHAKRAGRALGITECKCAILPSEGNNKKFVFSFKHEEDYMNFLIATAGNLRGTFARNLHFNSPEERNWALSKLSSFLYQNEIPADIVSNYDPKILRVITGSLFDNFAIVRAYRQNLFAAKKPDNISSPPAP